MSKIVYSLDMGLYFAYTTNIALRKSDSIFFSKNEKWYFRHKRQKDLFVFDDDIRSYESILLYTEKLNINSFEILLKNDKKLKELLNFLSTYLLDRDVSIGLISTSQDYFIENRELLDLYGVTTTHNVFRSSAFICDSDSEFDNFEVCGTSLVKKQKVAPPNVSSKQRTRSRLEINKIILDESFHDKFIKLLIESGKDNVDIYKKAGVTRQVFSKILSDKDMIPSKLTLISLCIGLELPLKEAKELMISAGYSLSRSILLDAIVMKYISDEIFDFELINDELDEHGCQLLGWHPRDN